MGSEALAIPLLLVALAAIAFRFHRTTSSSGERDASPERDAGPVAAAATHVPVEGGDDEIARWLWRNLVPPAGQSTTVQGELLRAVVKLQDEAQRNGNINWDEGFERFIDFLHLHLVTKSTLSDEKKMWTLADLNRLRNFLPVDQLEDHSQADQLPCVDDEVYDRLTANVVEFSRLNTRLIPREIDPEQYR
ncbi:MAG TPA: hypothetical protein VF861_16705 [Telluria sp.]